MKSWIVAFLACIFLMAPEPVMAAPACKAVSSTLTSQSHAPGYGAPNKAS